MAAFDDLLDFILPALAMRASRHLFHSIAAELFDLGRFVLAFLAFCATGLGSLRRGRARWHVALAGKSRFRMVSRRHRTGAVRLKNNCAFSGGID